MLHDSRQFIAFHFPAVGSLLTDNQKKLAGPLVDPFIAHGMLARTAGVASGSETDPLIALEGEAESMDAEADVDIAGDELEADSAGGEVASVAASSAVHGNENGPQCVAACFLDKMLRSVREFSAFDSPAVG